MLAAAGILAGALALRLWGIRHGLPYVYNADENAHFVPRAVGMFGHSLNPGYFVNPPAYTYLLHVVFDLRFGGRAGVGEAMAADRTAVFETARIVAAVLGTGAVALLAWAGRRLTGGAAGLIAGALLAVAFLPVHYSHLALNDAPTLAPVCLALLGVATIYRHNGYGGYAVAGAGARARLCDQVHGRDPGADDRRRRAGDARAGAAAARAGARGRARARGLPRREPLRAARPLGVPRGAQPPVRGRRRRRRQARPLLRQRGRLLPRHRHLGAGLAARAGGARRRDRAGPPRPPARAGARPGAARLPRLHGHPGPLLRALAAARLPAAVPARRLGGGGRGGLARPEAAAGHGRRRGGPGRAAVPAGARLQRPQRPRARPRRHPAARPRVDGRQRPDPLQGRDRAVRAGRLGGRRAERPRGHGQRPALEQVGDPARARRRGRRRAPLRGLRAPHPPGPGRRLRPRRLLLGRDGLDPVRARVRRAARGARRDPLLRGARARRGARVRGPARRGRQGPAAVLVRLLLQRLPARLRPDGARGAHLPALRRPL